MEANNPRRDMKGTSREKPIERKEYQDSRFQIPDSIVLNISQLCHGMGLDPIAVISFITKGVEKLVCYKIKAGNIKSKAKRARRETGGQG